ncbi:MAG TPA: VOC family protein [Candidatus Saccharimonadales bacterium]|nr:VOC family protein [Candidatus Saccharimonadales bacterium]
MTNIDHVVLATTDLEHGQTQLWRGYGLKGLRGGSHRAWGTANLIVPLGSQYLEVVAVEDPELAATTPLGRAVLAEADRDRIQPLAVCLATLELGPVAARLNRAPEAGSRTLLDGSELRWTTVGLEDALGPRRLPFFISWEDPSRHPGAMAAAHGCAARGIANVEVGGPESVLFDHLSEEVTGVRAVGGAPGVRSLSLWLEDGSEVQLP